MPTLSLAIVLAVSGRFSTFSIVVSCLWGLGCRFDARRNVIGKAFHLGVTSVILDRVQLALVVVFERLVIIRGLRDVQLRVTS